MSRDNQDVNVPMLGPAEPAEARKPTQKPISNGHNKAPHAKSSWVTTLILVLLTTGCGVLGYLAFGMQTTLMQQKNLLAQAAEQMDALEQRLQLTNENAVESGETLEQRLTDLTTYVSQLHTQQTSVIGHNTQLEASVIQLEQTTQALAEQATGQGAQLDSVVESQKAATKQLEALTSDSNVRQQAMTQLTTLNKQFESIVENQQAEQQAMNTLTEAGKAQQQEINQLITELSELSKRISKLDIAAIELQTQVSNVRDMSSDQYSQQQKSIVSLTKRLDSVDSATKQLSRNSESAIQLSKRVKSNEQAISAIDGTRRQVNSDLLNIRQQLNALALKVGR